MVYKETASRLPSKVEISLAYLYHYTSTQKKFKYQFAHKNSKMDSL